MRQEEGNKGGGGRGQTSILTRGASVEVVVVLRDVCQDAEAVRNLKSHHVFCIQQRRNSQLLLRNPERLQITSTLANKAEEARGAFLESTTSGQRWKWSNKSHKSRWSDFVRPQ